MNASPANEPSGADNMKWGYAIAGAFALGFALLIQVAFDGLDEEGAANLPAIAAVPYSIAGKPGITVPLALIGLGLILRDALVNRAARMSKGVGTTLERPRKAEISAQRAATTAGANDELEVGEPIPDEAPSVVSGTKPAGRKIAALEGPFDGRGKNAPASTGGPIGDSNPMPQRADSGQVVLSSAKYLNKNSSGFRRGNTNQSSGE